MRRTAQRIGSGFLLALPASALWLVTGLVAAHPFHTSTTELRLNRQTAVLEFALKTAPESLADIPGARNSSGGLVARAQFEALVAEYLRRMISVGDSQGSYRQIEMLGVEPGVAESWVYFQFSLPTRTPEFCLDYPVFMDIDPTQINTVSYRSSDISRTVVLTQQQPQVCFLTGYK